jgi:hypothetical protein
MTTFTDTEFGMVQQVAQLLDFQMMVIVVFIDFPLKHRNNKEQRSVINQNYGGVKTSGTSRRKQFSVVTVA